MDKKEVSKRIDKLIADMQAIKTMLEDSERDGLHPKLLECIEKGICAYCKETLEGTPPKDIIRNVHRKCYRKIRESSESLETHVKLGLLGPIKQSGRKPSPDVASELLRSKQEESLGQSVATKMKDSLTKKKPKP